MTLIVTSKLLSAKHRIKSNKLVVRAFLNWHAFKEERSSLKKLDLQSLDINKNAHLLVLNSIEYLTLAQICIWSFLRQNPDYHIVLHSSRNLVGAAKRRFATLIRNDRLTLIELEESSLAWQTIKLEIILSMNGTRDVFMDADLRWNDSMPALRGVTAFLQEFEINKKSVSSRILEILPDVNQVHMMNLSFFSFGDLILNQSIILEIKNLQKKIVRLSQISNLSVFDQSSIRMSEQISLSVVLTRHQISCHFLKLVDSRNDGSFVESCYFGATGLGF